MNETLTKEGILKQEKIGYLKSKLNLQQGMLYLTPNRLVLEAHATGVSGFGLIGALLKRKVESKINGFDLTWSQIKGISRGNHGANKNVLEVTAASGETYRILVGELDAWEAEIKNRMA